VEINKFEDRWVKGRRELVADASKMERVRRRKTCML